MPRADTVRTRNSLLEAAREIFSQKGFRDATIAEICERAGTNIAAVNYHFNNKETLYIEAWRYAFQESVKAHPPDGELKKNATAEERLHAHIVATILRLADENNKEFLFVQRELANPTGLLEEVMRAEITPLREKTQNLVREMLGPCVSNDDVLFCETSIINQCINPMVAGSSITDKDKNFKGPLIIKDIKAYAEHVVKFSLAGIKAVRKNAEAASVKKSKD